VWTWVCCLPVLVYNYLCGQMSHLTLTYASFLQLNWCQWHYHYLLVLHCIHTKTYCQPTQNELWSRSSVCLSVCLSAAACPHYCTDPDVTWGSGRGCPLVVHCLANLQSVHGLRCYDNIMRTLVTGLRPSHDITSHCRGDPIQLMFPVADINATPGNCKPVTPRHLCTYWAINNCVFIHQR